MVRDVRFLVVVVQLHLSHSANQQLKFHMDLLLTFAYFASAAVISVVATLDDCEQFLTFLFRRPGFLGVKVGLAGVVDYCFAYLILYLN